MQTACRAIRNSTSFFSSPDGDLFTELISKLPHGLFSSSFDQWMILTPRAKEFPRRMAGGHSQLASALAVYLRLRRVESFIKLVFVSYSKIQRPPITFPC
ncbi:hypothetical protein HGRIS_004832 [Hohenbuehelia grisea]|uniref:Uncharacterized protein n=1 Tax=Hohenbuehelia grisea TaxID=104357 RepID=A0ABR3JDX6_9AGAR